MADFVPETQIILYKSTGVDDKNQPFFTSESAKMAWYNSHGQYGVSRYSYQREQRQYIRIEGKADPLREYDMLAFKNSTNKWVLCQIDGVEFVNPNTTEITFHTDYMQTYIEDIVFCPCWVEREMVDGDWAGSVPSWNNLQPEGIETGKMKRTLADVTSSTEFTDFSLVVLSAYDQDGEENYNIVSQQNVPNGLNRFVYTIPKNGEVAGFSTLLTKYTVKGIDVQKAIQGLYIVPTNIASGAYSTRLTQALDYSQIDGYTVVNAKCFSSEFYGIELSNRRGQASYLKPESIGNRTILQLDLRGNFAGGSGGFVLMPVAYEGNPQDFGVYLYNNAMAPFVSDGFGTWFAQNIGPMAISTAASLGLAVASGNPFMMLNAEVGVGASIMKVISEALDPACTGGQQSGSVLDIATDNFGFTVNFVHPYKANIQCIDEYFGRYGYRTNRFKVPNVNTRPKWNYVKTSDAAVRGPMTGAANAAICNMLNNGVTFWHLSGGENLDTTQPISANKE